MRISDWSSDVCSSDLASDDFRDLGILACYRPVAGTPDAAQRRSLDARDFYRLLALAHVDPGRAFSEYAAFYLATDGQRHGSDDQQAGVYLGDYPALLELGRAQGRERVGQDG